MSHRRRLLALGGAALGAALLGGCGFRPVYGSAGGAPAPASQLVPQLAAVRVAPVFERNGQILRRHLQRNLEGLRPGTPARFLLAVVPSAETEALGFREDGTITRVRVVATGDWVLSTDAAPPEVIERGRVRTLDSFNIPDLQFFAAEASREAMDQRVIEELGDRIVQSVALALRRRAGT